VKQAPSSFLRNGDRFPFPVPPRLNPGPEVTRIMETGSVFLSPSFMADHTQAFLFFPPAPFDKVFLCIPAGWPDLQFPPKKKAGFGFHCCRARFVNSGRCRLFSPLFGDGADHRPATLGAGHKIFFAAGRCCPCSFFPPFFMAPEMLSNPPPPSGAKPHRAEAFCAVMGMSCQSGWGLILGCANPAGPPFPF